LNTRKLIITAILLIFFANAYSQQKVDSLKTLINKTNGKEKVDLFSEISKQYEKIQPDSGIVYALKSKTLADQINYKFGTAISLVRLGGNYSNKSDFANALKYLNESLSLAKDLKDSVIISDCLNKMGRVYFDQSNYRLSLQHYFQSLAISERINYKAGIAANYNGIGILYDATGDNENALDYHLKALRIKEEVGDLLDISYSINNIGGIYDNLSRFDEALDYYKRSLAIKEKLHDKRGTGISLNNIGLIFFRKNNFKEAQEYFSRSLKIKEEIGDMNGISNTLIYFGDLEKAKNNYVNALTNYKKSLTIKESLGDRRGIANIYLNIGNVYTLSKKYDDAKFYLEKGIKLSRKVGIKDLVLKGLGFLSSLYKNEGDFKNALKVFEEHQALKDSLFSEQIITRISELQFRYEIEKNIKENELLKKDLKISELEVRQQTSLRNLFIIVSALIVLLSIVVYIRYREKNKLVKEIQRQKIELEKLNKTLNNTNKKLEELNNTKDKFFSIIAHDLKNPFNSILGFSEIIIEDIDELDKNTLSEYAQIINDAARGTNILLQNLLDWARTQTGQIEVCKEKFNLTEIIQENIQLLSLAADKKGLKLSSKSDQESVVYADKSMISTVIRNLISNAIKFTGEGEITVYIDQKENHFQISVSDTGKGISSEVQEKLFKMDSSFTTKGTSQESGTGLGLLLCREFVERNDGTIWVKSEIGKGSSFQFTAPKA